MEGFVYNGNVGSQKTELDDGFLYHLLKPNKSVVVEAPVRAVLRDWCRAVRPAVGDQVVFTTKRSQTPSGRVWGSVGAECAVPTEREWVSSQGVTLTKEKPVKWQTPSKAGPSLRKGL